MKKILLVSLLTAAIWVPAFAQDSQEVYLVDMERVLQESIAGKAAKNNFEADAKKRTQKIETMKAEFETMRKSYEKQASLLSEAAALEKRQALAKKEREIAIAMREEQAALAKKNNTEVTRVAKEARKIIAAMAKDKKIKFVVERNKRFVLFANPDYDLTDEVIEELDDAKIN